MENVLEYLLIIFSIMILGVLLLFGTYKLIMCDFRDNIQTREVQVGDILITKVEECIKRIVVLDGKGNVYSRPCVQYQYSNVVKIIGPTPSKDEVIEP